MSQNEAEIEAPAPSARVAPDETSGGRLLSGNRLLVAAFCVALAVVGALVLLRPLTTRGDSNEYYQMLFAFANHQSPDAQPQDTASYNSVRSQMGMPPDNHPVSNYLRTADNMLYSGHFWLYPLLSVPALKLLDLLGTPGAGAFEVTNFLMLVAALAMILFFSGLSTKRRAAFALLLVLGPVIWYVNWPSPEIFSASLAISSIALYTRGNGKLAVMAAALASTQNPPLLALVALYMVKEALRIYRARLRHPEGRRGGMVQLLLLIAGALPACAPSLFFLWKTGTPNPLFADGSAGFGNISLQRTYDFFLDLNMGILPYLPLALPVAIFILVRAWRRRQWLSYQLGAVILTMVLLSETTSNWNSDAEGVMRYAVWIVPVLIWMIVAGLDFTAETDQVVAGALVAAQLFIAIAVPLWMMPAPLEHTGLARFVLDRFPYLYSPDPETFAERTLHKDGFTTAKGFLPAIYCSGDGYATKVLTDQSGLNALGTRIDVDAGFLAEQKAAHAGDEGLFYINSTDGKMRCRAG